MVFHSEGMGPVEVVKAMREIGFEETIGTHDFVFKWEGQASPVEVEQLAGRLHARLKGFDVHYEITTLK
jgi:hypothetical protein